MRRSLSHGSFLLTIDRALKRVTASIQFQNLRSPFRFPKRFSWLTPGKTSLKTFTPGFSRNASMDSINFNSWVFVKEGNYLTKNITASASPLRGRLLCWRYHHLSRCLNRARSNIFPWLRPICQEDCTWQMSLRQSYQYLYPRFVYLYFARIGWASPFGKIFRFGIPRHKWFDTGINALKYCGACCATRREMLLGWGIAFKFRTIGADASPVILFPESVG